MSRAPRPPLRRKVVGYDFTAFGRTYPSGVHHNLQPEQEPETRNQLLAEMLHLDPACVTPTIPAEQWPGIVANDRHALHTDPAPRTPGSSNFSVAHDALMVAR